MASWNCRRIYGQGRAAGVSCTSFTLPFTTADEWIAASASNSRTGRSWAILFLRVRAVRSRAMNIRFTLVAEGSTDVALLPIINWALRANERVREVEPQFVHPNQLPPANAGLAERIRMAWALYPADILFVHRDADRESLEVRRSEIQRAVEFVGAISPHVPVVPVRMTEAWLLIEENAIREAAANPRGTMPLGLPKISGIERVADPKQVLYDSLRKAADLSGRRLKKFHVPTAAGLVADRIRDFSPLRQLGAFLEFELLLRQALDRLAT